MDIDTFSSTTQPVPPPGEGKPSGKKGRRAAAAADLDIEDKESGSKINLADDAGDSGVTRQQGWGADTNPSTAGGRSSTSRRNQKAATLGGGGSFFDSKQKKTVVGGSVGGEEIADLMDDIPDMMDMTAEQVDIAAAPAMRSANVVKTVEELENEINNSSYTINQMQLASVQGLDLSLLISNCMVPIEQLEEEDAQWEWDVVFNQIVVNKIA